MRQRWWVLGAILVAILCFFCIRYIVNNLWPDPDEILAAPQFLLISFIFVGSGAASIPFTVYLNNRFAKPGWLERDRFRLLREGTWIGSLGVLLAYLQLLKALNWTIATVLTGVFVFIEAFFLTRE
jgi:hypothetical protein